VSPTIEVIEVALPLRRPFRTAVATITTRHLILVAISDGAVTGWGEAAPFPGAGSETRDEVWQALCEDRPIGAAAGAVEAAHTELQAHRSGMPVWQTLGGTPEPLPASEAVGILNGNDLLAAIADTVAAGIGRIKLKIVPGWDVEPLGLVRDAFPHLLVGLDANGSYQSVDACPWRRLEPLGPAYLEQPFPSSDLANHATLRRRTAIPICLDESVAAGSASVREALQLEAADLISVKPGNVGMAGALDIHRMAADAGIGLKAGGMLESSVGKAATVAVGSLPGFVEFDLAPAARFFEADVVSNPWSAAGGAIAPRTLPGWGVTPDAAAIAAVTVRRRVRPYSS